MSTKPTIPTVQLNSGFSMPLHGLGTWRSEPGVVKAAVKTALLQGYTHIDCAACYGNEKEIGEAFAEVFADESNSITRESIFITSKLWSQDHKDVRGGCQRTLTDLGLAYLDLYVIHNPIAFEGPSTFEVETIQYVPIAEKWAAMEALVTDGLVKSIGTSNFSTALVYEVLAVAKIRPAVSQIERHPYLVQENHISFLKSHGIHVTGYSPLGNPGFYSAGPEPQVLKNDVVTALAEKYSKTPAQILIRWQIDGGHTVIPKTTSETRLAENLNVFDFALNEEDITALNGLDQNFRFLTFDFLFKGHSIFA